MFHFMAVAQPQLERLQHETCYESCCCSEDVFFFVCASLELLEAHMRWPSKGSRVGTLSIV